MTLECQEEREREGARREVGNPRKCCTLEAMGRNRRGWWSCPLQWISQAGWEEITELRDSVTWSHFSGALGLGPWFEKEEREEPEPEDGRKSDGEKTNGRKTEERHTKERDRRWRKDRWRKDRHKKLSEQGLEFLRPESIQRTGLLAPSSFLDKLLLSNLQYSLTYIWS